MPNEPLSLELQTYKAHLSELEPSEGKFALVCERKVLGVYDTYRDALAAGYEKVGLRPFLVKQISKVETVSFFSRDIAAACHT